jgi:hypothetical protein
MFIRNADDPVRPYSSAFNVADEFDVGNKLIEILERKRCQVTGRPASAVTASLKIDQL